MVSALPPATVLKRPHFPVQYQFVSFDSHTNSECFGHMTKVLVLLVEKQYILS